MPSEKALRDVRRRLGPEPLKALFEVVAGPLAQPHTPGVRFAGLRTVAFDGLNSVKVPDTSGNRAWAGEGPPPAGPGRLPRLAADGAGRDGTGGLLGVAIGSVSDLTRANRLVTCFEPLEDVAGGVGEVGGEGEALAVDLDGR